MITAITRPSSAGSSGQPPADPAGGRLQRDAPRADRAHAALVSGDEWVAPLLGTAVFLYGGPAFLKAGWAEIKNRQPGMMLLIANEPTSSGATWHSGRYPRPGGAPVVRTPRIDVESEARCPMRNGGP